MCFCKVADFNSTFMHDARVQILRIEQIKVHSSASIPIFCFYVSFYSHEVYSTVAPAP